MTSQLTIPRLVIAGTASGVGKTTVMVGLCRALRLRGLKVAVFKTGPDYLDPTYHSIAADTQSHTLDGWMMGKQAVLDTFVSVCQEADIALIEGVMGLFDGASPTSDDGSTAQIAKWLHAPVLLVIDASGMARTVAAVAQGCVNFDPELWLAGVICNNIGSRNHLTILRVALSTPPVVGGLPKRPSLKFPERHLGLHTANDALSTTVLNSWSDVVCEWFDIDQILTTARSARDLKHEQATNDRTSSGVTNLKRCRIGYAFDAAFHFYYEDNLRRLRELGAELIPFSPLNDQHLPTVDGLYLGGGYPELHAAALSSNNSLKMEIIAFAGTNAPIYAECGGLMYLSSAIQNQEGQRFPMLDLIHAEVVMCERLQALGYVEVETTKESILGPSGLRFRGHQFRYSELNTLPDQVECGYELHRRRNGSVQIEGYMNGNILASYVHAHWASNPSIASGFVESCVKHSQKPLLHAKP